jgi:hypothetical protein
MNYAANVKTKMPLLPDDHSIYVGIYRILSVACPPNPV